MGLWAGIQDPQPGALLPTDLSKQIGHPVGSIGGLRSPALQTWSVGPRRRAVLLRTAGWLAKEGPTPFFTRFPCLPPRPAATAGVAGGCHRVAQEVSGLRAAPTEISLSCRFAFSDTPRPVDITQHSHPKSPQPYSQSPGLPVGRQIPLEGTKRGCPKGPEVAWRAVRLPGLARPLHVQQPRGTAAVAWR